MNIPTSMDGLTYFRRQTLGKGKVVSWVRKLPCPKCKTLMGKPVEKGKVKIRAKVFVCPKCAYEEPKKVHTDKLEAEIVYSCPSCTKNGEAKIPFKRKKVKILVDDSEKVVEALVFHCKHCKEKIVLAKKMKGQ